MPGKYCTFNFDTTGQGLRWARDEMVSILYYKFSFIAIPCDNISEN